LSIHAKSQADIEQAEIKAEAESGKRA